jgi:hypothetical protein
VANLWWEPQRSFAYWKGVYWANPDLLGSPSLIRDDPNIDFPWGLGSPGPSIPVDHFSARWTRSVNVEDGLYRFTIDVDDGARLYVDDIAVIDDWYDKSLRQLTADYVVAGTAPNILRVEYYDSIGEARMHLNWYKVNEPMFFGWKGEYFANPHLAGPPAMVRDDPDIVFDWEDRSPAPSLPADNFSVRWTRERQVTPGWYRFTFWTDDGVRFWVDDELVLDEWHQSWDQTYQVDVPLSWKPKLRVEYYEGTGDARAHVGQEHLK